MKTNYMLAGLVAACLSLSSCDDFFETTSKTDLNTETAYSNLETAEMALIGCYDGWQVTTSAEGVGMYLLAEFASDQAHAGLGYSDAKNNNVLDQFTTSVAPSYNDIFNTDWINYYQGIYRCNQLLENENNIDWDGDETAHARVIGETRAIRAILYFDLVRMFGDVPLILVPTDENVPRNDASEVYEAIIEDLKFAAENIAADAYPVANNNSNDGRISKYAAEALLARVYLYYSGYYGEEPANCTKAEATEALKDVIDNGGYELEENYADLFMPACTEDATVDGTYAWSTTYAGKYYNSDGWHAGQGQLSKEFVLNLKFNSTQDYNGNNDGNTFCVYLGPRNQCATSVCIASGWGAVSVTQAFVDEFQADPRFSTCVWSCDDAGFSADVNDSYEYTGYYSRKYAPMCFADGTRQEAGFNLGEAHQNITYYQDWTIMRYADVLLMYSELTQTADGINQVRARAGLTTTVAYSDENLRRERAIEFAFEGIHFWDIMRYEKDGAYAARAIAEAQNGASVINGGVSTTTTFDESNFTSKKGLMQIPNTQITLSGNVLTQNAGW